MKMLTDIHSLSCFAFSSPSQLLTAAFFFHWFWGIYWSCRMASQWSLFAGFPITLIWTDNPICISKRYGNIITKLTYVKVWRTACRLSHVSKPYVPVIQWLSRNMFLKRHTVENLRLCPYSLALPGSPGRAALESLIPLNYLGVREDGDQFLCQ